MVKVQVERYNGSTEVVEVEKWDDVDAAEVETKMKSSDTLVIRIGNQLFGRIEIRHVKPIEEVPVEETPTV